MKAQKFGDKNDEPANNDIVDANMRVLRERIEKVKKKEMVMMMSKARGWNYKRSYEQKREAMISEIAETMGLACGAIGLVFLSGSLCICLVSLLSHHHI